MTELFIRRPITIPPPYEGGGQGVVGALENISTPSSISPLIRGRE